MTYLLTRLRPEVLVTHTKDLGQILKAIHTAHNSISGEIDIPTSIAVAQLALKHRENKNLRQRIIVFVASPLQGPAADEKNIIKLAKKLKKNNVAVDVVAFGDGIEQGEKTILKVLTDGASSGDNSYVSFSKILVTLQVTHLPQTSRFSSSWLSIDFRCSPFFTHPIWRS